LTFELLEGNGSGPIRVHPEHQPCLVEVGDILIRSSSGELLWSDNASNGARKFAAAGNVAVFPVGNGSVITSLGNDPQLLLPTPNLQQPLKLTISLRVSLAPNPAPEIIHSLVKEVRANAEQQVSVAQFERDTVSNQLAKTTTDIGQVTSELGRVKADLVQVAAAQNETQQALNRTQDLLVAAEDRLRQMQDSLSWKVTEPIRKVMTALRSGPRKSK